MNPPMNPIYPTNNNSLHFYLVIDYSKRRYKKVNFERPIQLKISWIVLSWSRRFKVLKFSWPEPGTRRCVAIYPKLSQMKILYRPIYFSRHEPLDVFQCPVGQPAVWSGPYHSDLFRPYPWIFSNEFPVLYALCPSMLHYKLNTMTHFNFIFICLNVERTIPQITEVSITPFRQS